MDDTKNTGQRTEFGYLLRRLRRSRGLKHRHVGEAIGVALSTSANMECAPYKVIGADRVDKLCEFYALPPPLAAQLREAWQQLPLSEYQKKTQERWKRLNEMRRTTRAAPQLRVALAEVISLLMFRTPTDQMCACPIDVIPVDPDPFVGQTAAPPPVVQKCEVCSAMMALGFADGWTNADECLRRLLEVQRESEQPGYVAPGMPKQSKTP
jgi:transcriptional regulator with XRE-family HTH domain